MIKAWPTKDPDAALPHWFNWSDWSAIESGGDIASYEVDIDGPPDSALVAYDIAQGTGEYLNYIQVWLRGGTEGETYTVRCRVVLEDGQTDDASRDLTIASH